LANKFREEYVPINGIDQYFLHVPGEGSDVLIMLHGGPGLANSYIAYYHQPYTDFCNVVYYDQRGAGKTQIKNRSSSESLTLETLLEDLRQTIAYIKDRYNTNRVFLAGHSWGSMLGTCYILAYPGDVAGYIGYGQSVPGGEQDRSYYEFVKREAAKSGNQEHIETIDKVSKNFPNVPREDYFEQYNIIAGVGFGGGYDFMAKDVFELYVASPTWTDEDEVISENIEKLNEKLYADAIFDWKIGDEAEYSVPVYYVLGRHDEMTSSVIAAKYFETVKAPKKGLYWIEDAGHLLDTDKPSEFFRIVKEILSQV